MIFHGQPHPNATRATQAWAAAQTLHVATAYSNPCRWETRRRLFDDYRRHMTAAANVRLYVGELAYGDRPHEVTSPVCDDDLQLRTRSELWHKENLLNRVIQKFPSDWRYGAYCDGDFHFTRHDWALEAIQQLQHFDFVQLFSTYGPLDQHHVPLSVRSGFAFGLSGPCQDQPADACTAWPRYGYGVASCDGKPRGGAPGGAWAFRREAFERVGGLLDVGILGAGDHHMAVGLALLGDSHLEIPFVDGYRRAIRAWQARAATLQGNIGYVACHAVHHFHGRHQDRGHGWRWKILERHAFDPTFDLVRDAQGIWQLTPEKPQLQRDIRAYFLSRNEDSR